MRWMVRCGYIFRCLRVSVFPVCLFVFEGCRVDGKECLHSQKVSFICLEFLKDGAYYCYCACVLCILRYLGFPLVVVPINTGIFLRGLKLCGESIT